MAERMLKDEVGARGAGVTETKAPARKTTEAATAALSASLVVIMRMVHA